jgi:hypothetical protein
VVERATVSGNGLRVGGGITVTPVGAEGKSAGAEPAADGVEADANTRESRAGIPCGGSSADPDIKTILL